MYAEVAIASTTVAVACMSVARLLRDVMVVRLLRTMINNGSLDPKQRFDICVHLASALGSNEKNASNDGCDRTASLMKDRQEPRRSLSFLTRLFRLMV